MKFINQIGVFFKRLFQSKKEKKEKDDSLLQGAYDLLMELTQKWTASPAEGIDLVDYTNLLLQKAKEVSRRKNKPIVREIQRFAKKNCLAGVIPESELERVRKETKELLALLTRSF